jgi:hypothetical protein
LVEVPETIEEALEIPPLRVKEFKGLVLIATEFEGASDVEAVLKAEELNAELLKEPEAITNLS